MSASSTLRNLLLFSVLATAVLALALLGPVAAGSFVHHEQMPGLGEGFLHDAIVVCLINPTTTDWSLLLLLGLPALGLAAIMVACPVLLAAQWYRTRALVRQLLVLGEPADEQPWSRLVGELGLGGKVDYLETARPVAFCYGWLRPRICLSRGALAGLDDPEVAALLLHERHHMLSYDPLKTALAYVLSRVFFFLPIVSSLRKQYILAREVEADQYVLRCQQTNEALLGALCKTIIRRGNGRVRQPHRRQQISVAGYGDHLNERLDFLLSGTTRPYHSVERRILFRSALAVGAILLLVALSTTNAAANALWHQAHCTLTSCPIMH